MLQKKFNTIKNAKKRKKLAKIIVNVLCTIIKNCRHTFVVWKKADGSMRPAFYQGSTQKKKSDIKTEQPIKNVTHMLAQGFSIAGVASLQDGNEWTIFDFVSKTAPGMAGLTKRLLEEALDRGALRAQKP